MTSSDILHFLRQGRFDDAVDEIFNIAKQRIMLVAERRMQFLSIGDEVRLCERTKPQVLAGASGQVAKVGQTTVWVRLHDGYSKEFPAACTVEVPNTVIELA
jgi:hypothetical protein